jgi:predicted transposase/invertase (TIGR01784 family)
MAYSDRYISLLTDFGFKRIFGTEPNKRLPIDFLNTLLPPHHQIRDLTFKNTENLGNTIVDRRAIFDIYCEAENGDKFIVEIQRVRQAFFKDRSLYYATFPLQEQALKGEWDYELNSVYTVGVLDFTFEELRQEETLLHVIELKDRQNRVFYEKLKFIYIELPKFKKTIDSLETHLDKWLYLLQNLARLEEPPSTLQGEVFSELFEAAEIANFSPDEQRGYQGSLKAFRDWYAIDMTTRQEAMELGLSQGREQGRQEGKEEGRQEGKEEGRQEGKEEGKEEQTIALVSRLLTRRCRQEIPEDLRSRLSVLPVSVLETLSEDLLDFTTLADLETWLTARE